MTTGRHAGKVAVCVGSATGMGAQSAFRLACEGAKVVVGDINMEAAAKLVERIGSAGGEAVARECDIVSEEAVNALINDTARDFGGLDLMHVNAADLSLAVDIGPRAPGSLRDQPRRRRLVRRIESVQPLGEQPDYP